MSARDQFTKIKLIVVQFQIGFGRAILMKISTIFKKELKSDYLKTMYAYFFSPYTNAFFTAQHFMSYNTDMLNNVNLTSYLDET